MRELATQKLSQAYHLDEVAASVATMQSASTLEDVANLVLQRDPNNSDAKYVHFFHEKIPSRMLAKCTSLKPLDEVIADKPSEGAPLRTRAVTRIFKEDYAGAARDLTEGLAVCRLRQGHKRKGRGQELELAKKMGEDREWEKRLEDDEQPSSLETQLLFYRAGVYLTIACLSIEAALMPPTVSTPAASTPTESPVSSAPPATEPSRPSSSSSAATSATLPTDPDREATLKRESARKIVKTNAKRALRDYLKLLSLLDYTPGLPSHITEEFFRAVSGAATGMRKAEAGKLLQMFGGSREKDNGSRSPTSSYSNGNGNGTTRLPEIPHAEIYPVSTLFSSNPPPNLPPYPATALALRPKRCSEDPAAAAAAAMLSADSNEAITYHPLLTDSLHSLLLCHALIQTPAKELQRHAYMVARLARVCDGYPIFLAARSPARADWIEVLRRAGNWINLSSGWEALCTPAPLPSAGLLNQFDTRGPSGSPGRLARQAKAIKDADAVRSREIEALVDKEERMLAAQERERREKERQASGSTGAKRWAQEDGKEYPISTERAGLIARWVKEGVRREIFAQAAARKEKERVESEKGKEVERHVEEIDEDEPEAEEKQNGETIDEEESGKGKGKQAPLPELQDITNRIEELDV